MIKHTVKRFKDLCDLQEYLNLMATKKGVVDVKIWSAWSPCADEYYYLHVTYEHK